MEEALEKSIAKWESIVEGTGMDAARENCALCELFNTGNGCDGCPVYENTGENYCEGTPYIAWCFHHKNHHQCRHAPFMVVCSTCRELAFDEFEYLKTLR